MKAIALCFSIVFFNPLVTTAQQLLNGGFEQTYIDSSFLQDGVLTPNYWSYGWNPQDCWAPLGSISEESHSGDWALRLETRQCSMSLNSEIGFTTMEVENSIFLPETMSHPSGFRPDQFSFYYKYIPVEIDTARFDLLLFNYPDTITLFDPNYGQYIDTVGFSKVEITNESSQYLNSISNIEYLSEDTPQYVSVQAFSNKSGWNMPQAGDGQAGTTLWIDDIELIYLPTSLEEDKAELDVQVSPNPVLDRFEIKSSVDVAAESIALFDYQGRLVKTLNPQDRFHSMVGMEPGLYVLQLKTNKGVVVEKLVRAPH